ncbi:hypothetical protein [Pseudomonas hunanensis]|uniref:hypothetical protein n=1 Tax=Pseudomonas hunanensis TaxID=1247546 RepID=UPI0030DA0B57
MDNKYGVEDPLRHIHGVGYDEPREALRKYERAFREVAKQWRNSVPKMTPRLLEACNSYNVLRYACDKELTVPDKLSSTLAENLILGIGFIHDVGA